ncbi:ribonuclease 3 [Geothrix limicola]|uniref:Ribonuclease 3 n=1 Tax=Geothrix limicola TaxID=2927978 RepID=A0ABQ5QF84_9BACT|nr:ribonuclease III domain-containing protein [Geothrix limicola]GLH73186.1 ribonuclease 3 [Geothrix limicola]
MTRSKADVGDLEARLGYRFQDPTLLREALTHTSAGLPHDNQRLEFLGDALLNFAVALILHRERPDWQEGPMSKLRGVLVRTDSLHAWAADLGLDRALKAVHPRKAPPMGPKPLADALEALLAAVYLDAQATGSDGTARVAALVEARFLEPIRQARPESWTRSDPKTHLQETAARLGLPAPVYAQVDLAGPGHAPRFTMRVSVGSLSAQAEGPTRKRAEGEAAQRLLDQLGTHTES